MVCHTSIFSAEKYLLRNISVGGVVVWDNSDKVWCNILEIKRMRSQGSHHHPALNKERRRQYGLCSQGDYSIDPRIYLPIEVCSTISFQSREDLIYFHYWPKLWGFPRLHSRALLSRVDSRYFAWNTWSRTTNLPSIMQPCRKLLRLLKVTFFLLHFEYNFDSVDRKEVGCYNYLLDWIWFDLAPQQTWKGPSLKMSFFLNIKGLWQITKYVEVSLVFQQLNKTYYKKIENQKPLPSELYTQKFSQHFDL